MLEATVNSIIARSEFCETNHFWSPPHQHVSHRPQQRSYELMGLPQTCFPISACPGCFCD